MPVETKRQFNLETQRWEEFQEEQPTALEFLQRTYRDVGQPLSTRIRCAVEALPFEAPKLSAVGVGYLDSTDLATKLDRRIAALANGARVIEGRVVSDDDGEGDDGR
jgi:hypothetical protein